MKDDKNIQGLTADQVEATRIKAVGMLQRCRAWFLIVVPRQKDGVAVDVKVSAIATAEDAAILQETVEQLRSEALGFDHKGDEDNGTQQQVH